MWSAKLVDSHIHLEAGVRLRELPEHPFAPRGMECGTPAELRFAASFCGCVEELVRDGCLSAELRFGPASWSRRGVSLPAQGVLLTRLKAWARAAHSFELEVVVTLKRDGSDKDWDFAESLIAEARQAIVAIDVSRSYALGTTPERGPALERLGSRCRALRDAGLDVYVHCGWFDDTNDVWSALDVLGACRIGHGLAMGEDRALWQRLARDGVKIEFCPSAARQLAGMNLQDHPLPRWAEAGIPFLVGSDHPRELRTTISAEYHAFHAIWPQLESARR